MFAFAHSFTGLTVDRQGVAGCSVFGECLPFLAGPRLDENLAYPRA
jgi:hypothetical protein